MRKPDLKQTYNYSTAVTDLRRTGTHHTNFSPFSVSTTANAIYPTVSPFLIVPALNNKPSATLKNDPKKKEGYESQIDWTDTKDIQAIVARTIETDIEQSIERNFGPERYVFSGERVCAEKQLPIPQEVKEQIMKQTNQRPNQKKIQVNYGYLSYANAVYYIIGQDLYVFRIQDLKERIQKDTVNDEISDHQPLMPVKLKQIWNQNCRKIHEINFSDDLKGFSSLNIPSKRALILEYPYHLEIVNYKFQQILSNSNNRKECKKTVFSIISLALCFSIESERADFITITPANTLLYIDDKGVLVNCIIGRTNGKLKKIIKKESFLQSKSTFLSKCNGFMRKIKQVAFQSLPFSFSFQLSIRKNLALVYDQRRSRVFTLTIKGDRSTIIQKLEKEINVYEFIPTYGGRMKCIWTIPEEQILRELDYPVNPPQIFVESIIKADPDYNQEASLIVLLSNGMKSYLQIGNEQCKFRWKCHPPQVANLKQAVQRKNNSLSEMANLKAGKDSNAIMMNKWSEKFSVDSSKNNQQKIFSYFNDRSISIGLVRSDKRMGMYLTVRKNFQKSDFYDVFDVKLNNEFFKRRLDQFPTKNSIFQNKCIDFQVENSLRVVELEKFETIHQLMSSTKYTHPNPTTEGSHELLRQVHHGPRHFTYLSNHFISTFVLVRPVDIVYYFVKFQRDTFCQNYLSSIICVNLSEISSMLLQIYTAPQGTSYFVPKNYMQNIEEILKQMDSNTKKVDTYASINFQSTFLNKNKKRLEWYRNQNYDQVIQFRKEANDYLLKTNIRSLFASFCIQQKLSNNNIFQNVKLQSIKKSSEEIDFETNVKTLSQQHKVQAKNCLVYISRVLYPFWNAKTLTVKKGEVYIQTIKNKVQELDDIVTLLKIQGNDYWHHLGSFLQKIHQIIEIFIWIQKIPYGLTLSEAMQKNLQYFQPFIFETLQYNYQPNFIQKFKQLFPLYITTEFETLIKIYKIIGKSKKENEIRKHLQALSSYPQYFINYLKRQKPFIDHTDLIVRDNPATYETEDIEMPVMPFARLLPFYFQKINNLSVKMTQKFIYLKLVKLKLQEQKIPNLPGKQIVESHNLVKFQAEYEETLKCLKLQQQCKQVIEEILQEEMIREKITGNNNRRKSGFLTSFFSKFTGFFGEQSEEKRQNLSKKSYQIKTKIHQSHRTIFEKLDYYIMKRKDFAELLQNMKNSYLDILYMSVFWNHNIMQSDMIRIRQSLKQHFKDLVRNGYIKFQNVKKALTDDHYERERYKKLVTYIKNQVIKIFSFLKSTHTYLDIPAFYDGLASELFEHNFTLLSITQTSSNHDKYQTQTYSIPTHLAENAFDTKEITDHIIGKILVPLFNSRNFEQSSQKHTIIKKWIYEWFMLTDMVIKYKKNDAQRLIHIMQDLKIVYKELLCSNPLNIYQPAIVSRMKQLLALKNDIEVII